MKIGIFCCGNYILGDDGFGIHVLRELQKKNLPENCKLFDVGLSGWNLLSYIHDFDKVIILDAINFIEEEGRLHRLGLEDMEKADESAFSTHRMGLNEILVLENFDSIGKLPDILFIGAEIKLNNHFTDLLSPSVREAVFNALEMVLAEVDREVISR